MPKATAGRYSSPVLQYMRVADAIAERIGLGRGRGDDDPRRPGELRPGDKLPSEPAIADEYQVAYSTARRATKELRDRGLIETIWGKGTFVREPQNRPE